jgi:beta-glucosidase
LLGWGKALLQPGETKQFAIEVDPRLLAQFDVDANEWHIAGGRYEFALGESSQAFTAQAAHDLRARTLPP